YVPESYTEFLNKDGLNEKRIGILKSFFGTAEIHKEVNEAVNKSLEDMKNNGAVLVPIEENIDADKLVKEVSVHLYDLKAHLNDYLKDLGTRANVHSLADVIASGKYHEGIEDNIKHAQTLDINTPVYNERLIKRIELRNLVMAIMAKYDLDAIIYPHQKRPVVKVGEPQIERNGVIGSVTGFPSCVVPAGFTKPTDSAPIGVPIGMEILCREWEEPILIEIAYAFEQATNYRKTPDLSSKK
ncbi:MAG: amidase family protein, partial [Lutispora sp.]|nr:amidase family protein [Lutispora sp.]